MPIYQEIPDFSIRVTYSKTTNLVFPFGIKSVDRGSAGLLAQKARGVDNVLRLKAGKKELEETNLSVITSDGKLYAFQVKYADNPFILNYSFKADTGIVTDRQVRIGGLPVNEWTLKLDAAKSKQAKSFLHKKVATNRLDLLLKSIYVSKGVMWFTLDIKNNTLLSFQPNLIRFFLKDNKRAKRTTQQEAELKPLFVDDDITVSGKQSKTITIGLPQFTVPNDQHLVIQLGEDSGSRMLFLQVKHKVILNTRVLP